MTWFESSANEAEADKERVALVVLVDFDFPSGHVRLCSGGRNISYGGNTYYATGPLGKISSPVENDRLVAERKTYQLAGAPVDPAVVSETDIDGSFGRDVVEYIAFVDVDTGELVDDPEVNYEGRIDQINRVDGASPVIEVNVEHRSVMLDQSSGQQYTHEHQQVYFPGDNGFDQVVGIVTKAVVWGGAVASPGLTPSYTRNGSNEE